MNTLEAFARGRASQEQPLRVFDWDKPAQLIYDRRPTRARAGLSEDWEWTGDTIYEDGKISKAALTHLESTWAIPELEVDGEIQDCWVWKKDHPEWNAKTYWPDSARKILNGAEK